MEQAGCSGLNLNVAARAAILHSHKRKIIIFKGNLGGTASTSGRSLICICIYIYIHIHILIASKPRNPFQRFSISCSVLDRVYVDLQGFTLRVFVGFFRPAYPVHSSPLPTSLPTGTIYLYTYIWVHIYASICIIFSSQRPLTSHY